MTNPYIKHNSIKIEILKPLSVNVLDQNAKKQAEELYSVYKGCLQAAKCLQDKDLFHDGWLLLNLSVECFFKYLYLLIRPEFEKVSKPEKEFPLGPREYDGAFLFYHSSALEGKLPTPRNFKHEVRELYELFERFTDAVNDENFKALRSSIPSEGDWVKQRYSLRNNPGNEKQFKEYLSDFEGALNTIFKDLK